MESLIIVFNVREIQFDTETNRFTGIIDTNRTYTYCKRIMSALEEYMNDCFFMTRFVPDITWYRLMYDKRLKKLHKDIMYHPFVVNSLINEFGYTKAFELIQSKAESFRVFRNY